LTVSFWPIGCGRQWLLSGYPVRKIPILLTVRFEELRPAGLSRSLLAIFSKIVGSNVGIQHLKILQNHGGLPVGESALPGWKPTWTN